MSRGRPWQGGVLLGTTVRCSCQQFSARFNFAPSAGGRQDAEWAFQRHLTEVTGIHTPKVSKAREPDGTYGTELRCSCGTRFRDSRSPARGGRDAVLTLFEHHQVEERDHAAKDA